jgi:hypothetical protein
MASMRSIIRLSRIVFAELGRLSPRWKAPSWDASEATRPRKERQMTTNGAKIALVTGASRGLGRNITIAPARKGVEASGGMFV